MDSPSPLSIKKWAEEDRPREKLLLKGKSALSDAELLGILLGSGTRTLTAVDLAKLILHEAQNDLHKLAKYGVSDLVKFKGIGEAKAITIVSALELGRRRKEMERTEQVKLQSGNDVYQYMKSDLDDLPHEEFWVILLKRNNEVIKKIRMSSGGIVGTVVDARMIFKSAIEELATSIILVHNHPSGSLKPSNEDKALTTKLKEGGKVMDIKILDHIIISSAGYFSFQDENLL